MSNDNRIVELSDTKEYDLFCRSVYGLQIFRANEVEVNPINDPRVIFLRSLISERACSCQVGISAMEGDEPEEFFSRYGQPDPYQASPIGLYGGTFYQVDDGPGSCFFPIVHNPFLGTTAEDFTYLLVCDAYALYVGEKEISPQEVQPLLTAPFTDQAEWMQRLARQYDCIVTTGYDGWYIEIYARDPANFALLSNALDLAVQGIENNAWYQQHSRQLKWDDEKELCLRL